MTNLGMEPSVKNNSSLKNAERPIERIHFATERARHAYNRIRRMLRANAEKLNRYKSFGNICENVKEIVGKTEKDVENPKTGKKRLSFSCDSAESTNSKRRKTEGRNILEDPFIASLGPIPPENSDIFENTSFVICHARDVEDESEEDAEDTIFFSEDRLSVQIKMGGGKVYESIELVPEEEHERTKIITNASCLDPQRIWSLKADVQAYSHVWIIRCCQKNKPLDPSRHAIPTARSAS